MISDFALGLLTLAESLIRTILGAVLLRYLGAPWWAVTWFALSGFRWRLFYRRPPQPRPEPPPRQQDGPR